MLIFHVQEIKISPLTQPTSSMPQSINMVRPKQALAHPITSKIHIPNVPNIDKEDDSNVTNPDEIEHQQIIFHKHSANLFG
jgi:hypothetical protein